MAATARSSPACSGTTRSAACASGLPSTFTRAQVSAPAARARVSASTRSGLPPDWLIARTSAPRRSRSAPYTPLTLGAALMTGRRTWVSSAYFRVVAAWSDDPRASVTT